MDAQDSESAPQQQQPQQDQNTVRMRLDPREILFEIQKKLEGRHEKYYLNQNGVLDSKTVQYGKRLLNDEGIQSVMNRAYSIINQATVLGYFKDENDKNRFFMAWKDDFRKELFINKYNFGMETPSNVIHVLNVVSYFADLFLTRLLGGREAEQLSKQHNIVERVDPGQDNPRNFLGFKSK